MAQNIYDDPAFLEGYSQFPRSRDGLAATSEWPAFRALLPPLKGIHVVDLGCGFGHLTRWLAAEGCKSVLGIDLSEAMLTRAQRETSAPSVRYRRDDLEGLVLEAGSADLIVSSMAFHYLEDFERLCAMLWAALAPGGELVFSVEHPIYAARAEPEWVVADDGRRAFAIADYAIEGARETNWIVDGVIKYHRTIGSMLNMLGGAGFNYRRVVEWAPGENELVAHPEWRQTELTRPMFLIIAVSKGGEKAN